MDKRTQKKIQKICEKVNKEGGIKEIRMDDEINAMRDAVNTLKRRNSKMTKSEEEAVKLMEYQINDAENMKPSQEIDEKRADEIENEIDRNIKKAIKKGRLPEPDMKEYRRFINKLKK